MINKKRLVDISKTLAEITTGSNITYMFHQLGLKTESSSGTKWVRIHDAIVDSTNPNKLLFEVIEYIMTPSSFGENPNEWNEFKKRLNSMISFDGYEINNSGKIIKVNPIRTIHEAKERYHSLSDKLDDYVIHDEVIKYCTEDLLKDDYFSAIFESSKGVLYRIQTLSELSNDGAELIQEAFSTKQPLILITGNMLETKTEKSMYNGLKNLLFTIVSLYRNPKAHTPKLYDENSETDAITAFTLMSLAHRILDSCVNVRDL